MSQDRESRTEEATARQQQRFREEGKIAVSKDVNALAVLFATCGLMIVAHRSALHLAKGTLTSFLGELDQLALPGRMHIWTALTGKAFFQLVLPIASLGLAAALLSGFGQTRGLFTTEIFKLDLSRLNPLPRLRQIVGSKDSLISVALQTGRVAVIGAITTRVLWADLETIVHLCRAPVEHLPELLVSLAVRLLGKVALLLVVFAALDFVANKRRLNEQMKMTKQEVKREHREQEGDPEQKKRQRARARELGRNRIIAAVPKSDVVVVNPTHYAVALKYDAISMSAPRVTAKGKDHRAARIREIAKAHGVPIISNPPLTRSLFSRCKVEGEVPPELYGAVAEVLATIYRIKNRWVEGTA